MLRPRELGKLSFYHTTEAYESCRDSDICKILSSYPIIHSSSRKILLMADTVSVLNGVGLDFKGAYSLRMESHKFVIIVW